MSIKPKHDINKWDQIPLNYLKWFCLQIRSLPCVRVLRIRLLQLRAAEFEAMVHGLSGMDSSVKTFSLHKKQWSFYKTGKMCLPFLSHKQACWGKRGLEVSIKSELGVEMTVGNISSCSFLQKRKNPKLAALAGINLQLGSRAKHSQSLQTTCK